MSDPERKSLRGLQVEIKDTEKGLVRATIAKLNVKDHDNDLTLPGAFGDQKVRVSAYEHGSWAGALPVGKGTVTEKDGEAVAELKFFMTTPHGRDHFQVVKEMGELQEWSYGFDVKETGEVTEDMRQSGVERVLKSVHVHEVSPVLLGAGVGTRTQLVKSGGESVDRKPETTSEFGKILLKLRDEQELSNADLAEAMDVSTKDVAEFLKTRRPSLRHIDGAAELLKTSIGRLRGAAERDGHDYGEEDEYRILAARAYESGKAAEKAKSDYESGLAELQSGIEAKTAAEAKEAEERAEAFQAAAKQEFDRFTRNMGRYQA